MALRDVSSAAGLRARFGFGVCREPAAPPPMEELVKEEYSAVPPESYEASIPVPPVSHKTRPAFSCSLRTLW